VGANLEWDCIPITLSTLQGTLNFNTPDVLGTGEGGFYLLRREECRMGFTLRSTVDDISADDGSIVHKVLASGYEVRLSAELWAFPGTDGNRGEPASGAVLVEMNDLLMRHLNRCRDDGLARLIWTPTGGSPQRMIDDLFWTDDEESSNGGGNDQVWVMTWGMRSPFPYAQDAAENTTTITDGNSDTLLNAGTARFYPVIKIYGPATDVTITNDANDGIIHYDSAQPGAVAIGGGDYVEVDTFRQTAFLNGDVANRLPGIDPFVTEFFKLEIGNNLIGVTGADIDILWQSAWA
jgi:hypothetical protein